MRLSIQTSTRLATARSSRGMTLIEILVVLAIIGLIMGGVAVVAFKALSRSKRKTAAMDIKNLDQAVSMYRLERGRCPKTQQELVEADVTKRVYKDPWGSEYAMECPGEHEEVDIRSAGEDRELETDDDINSWELD